MVTVTVNTQAVLPVKEIVLAVLSHEQSPDFLAILWDSKMGMEVGAANAWVVSPMVTEEGKALQAMEEKVLCPGCVVDLAGGNRENTITGSTKGKDFSGIIPGTGPGLVGNDVVVCCRGSDRRSI